MRKLIVVTYKLPTDEWTKRMYGHDVEHIYDCQAFWDEELSQPEIKKLQRKYTEVDSFVCDFAAYSDWIDNESEYEHFVKTGICPLKPVHEAIDAETGRDTVKLNLILELERTTETSEFEYSIDVDEAGQIVLTPKDETVSFVSIKKALDDASVETTVDGNKKILPLNLTADMISDGDNFDWFVDIDEIGQAVITPDAENTSFLTVSVEGSLNLVTEESKDMKFLKESGYRDFEWNDTLYAVIKDDGSYAGVPCTSYGEAQELSRNHEGSRIFKLVLDEDSSIKEELTERDTREIADKVMRGDIPIYTGDGTPANNMIHIPELDNCQGKVCFEYYYDDESFSVVSYAVPARS